MILEEGIDRFKQFSARGDRGGPALVQGADPRDDRARAATAPPAFIDVTFADKPQLPARARRDFVMHAPFEVRIGGDGDYALDMDGASAWGWHSMNCTPSGMQGAIWVHVHPDPDLQRQGQRRRLLRDRDQLPRGHDRQPRRRRGLDRDRLGVPAARLHRLPADPLARAPGARLHRGGDRALLGLRQRDPGRRDRPVRELVGDHELRDRGPGDGRQVRARRDRHLRGDVQPRGRRGRRRDVGADLPDDLPLAPDQGEHRRAPGATAAAPASSRCSWSGTPRSGSSRTSARRGSSPRRASSAAIRARPPTSTTSSGADLRRAGAARRGLPGRRRDLRRPGADGDRGRAHLQAGQLHDRSSRSPTATSTSR